MSAHVLLNLLNELALPSVLSTPPTSLINSGARMQDSVYNMILKPHLIREFCIKTSRCRHQKT